MGKGSLSSSKTEQKLCMLIKYLQKMTNCDVTFTYLSYDSEIHKLWVSWLSIPQKMSIISTAVSEVWIKWNLSLPTIPSSSKRSLGSQMLNPYWPHDLCNQELTCRIHLVLPMSCPFTNRMEKKFLGPSHPPSLLFPELKSALVAPEVCQHYYWFLH